MNFDLFIHKLWIVMIFLIFSSTCVRVCGFLDLARARAI